MPPLRQPNQNIIKPSADKTAAASIGRQTQAGAETQNMGAGMLTAAMNRRSADERHSREIADRENDRLFQADRDTKNKEHETALEQMRNDFQVAERTANWDKADELLAKRDALESDRLVYEQTTSAQNMQALLGMSRYSQEQSSAMTKLALGQETNTQTYLQEQEYNDTQRSNIKNMFKGDENLNFVLGNADPTKRDENIDKVLDSLFSNYVPNGALGSYKTGDPIDGIERLITHNKMGAGDLTNVLLFFEEGKRALQEMQTEAKASGNGKRARALNQARVVLGRAESEAESLGNASRDSKVRQMYAKAKASVKKSGIPTITSNLRALTTDPNAQFDIMQNLIPFDESKYKTSQYKEMAGNWENMMKTIFGTDK